MGSLSQIEYRRLLQHLLRQARIDAGLRQDDVARRLGQPQSYVSKYESGERRVDLADLHDICKAIGIPLVELVREMEQRTDYET